MHSHYLLPRLRILAGLTAIALIAQSGHQAVTKLSNQLQLEVTSEPVGTEHGFQLLITMQFNVPLADAPTRRIE
ncbi:MAG: hypothetical protein ACX930_04480 [Erythrobacter sp.]